MSKESFFCDFFTGINYWSSENTIKMWDDFHADSVENDLKRLHDAGITHLRIFPLWSSFQPLTADYSYNGIYEYRFNDGPLPDTEAGRAGVSEQACANFETFCALADQYQMKLIVGLITGHMSFGVFAPPAFAGKNHLADPTIMKWQIRFVRYFVTRFRTQNAIIGWDLGNEVTGLISSSHYTPDEFYVWCALIANTIRSCDPLRPVISGLGDPGDKLIENGRGSVKEICEICDIHTYHPYQVFSTSSDPLNTMKPILDLAFKCRIGEDIGGKPTFIQEFGSIGYLNCSYKSEADFYRAALLSTLAHGGHGVMWWCAFDQGKFDFAPYDWNNRGSDYGFFDRDGNPKRLVEENLRFKKRLSAIPGGNLPKHTVNGVIVVPRDDGDANKNVLRSAFILAKQANLDLGFTYALDSVPDSPLYILPSLSQSMSIPKRRLDKILENVRNGAVLYVSLGTAFFRDVPGLFGVTFESRTEVRAEKMLVIDGVELPVSVDVQYAVEEVTAQVRGRDQDGTPMFFKSDYGKGKIFFLTVPIEKDLSERYGAFFKDGQPDYSIIYRELGAAAGIRRIADSDNRNIRLTEHRINDTEYDLFAINYGSKPGTATITLYGDFDVETIFGPDIHTGQVEFPACDGGLYRLKRRESI